MEHSYYFEALFTIIMYCSAICDVEHELSVMRMCMCVSTKCMLIDKLHSNDLTNAIRPSMWLIMLRIWVRVKISLVRV